MTARAAAQGRSPLTHFEWQVPPAVGCIPARELQREVESLLGHRVFGDRAEAERFLSGGIEDRHGTWVAVLRLTSRTASAAGTREVIGGDQCGSLGRTLVIVVATMLDAPLPERPHGAAVSLGVGLGLDLDRGPLPSTGVGMGLLVELRLAPRWPAIRLTLGGLLPQRELSSDVGARFDLLHGSLAVCPTLLGAVPLKLALCTGLELGVMRAHSLGLAPARDPARLLANIPLEAELTWRIFARLWLRVGGGVALATLRPAFYFEEADGQMRVLHRVSLLAVAGHFSFIVDVL